MSDKIYFAHIPVANSRVTLAYSVYASQILVATAFCSPKDQFSRRKGRSIAAARLMHNYRVIEINSFNLDPSDEKVVREIVVREFYIFLEKNSECDFIPYWVRDFYRPTAGVAGIDAVCWTSDRLKCRIFIDEKYGLIYLSRDFIESMLSMFPPQLTPAP